MNYDGLQLDERLSDAYIEMVEVLQSKYYSTAARYATLAFMRAKLGAALPLRNLQRTSSKGGQKPRRS